MWAPGDHIGPYRIESVLKSGGMGSLFLAHKRGAAGFARRVAIKVIHAHLADDQGFVRMFIDEAKLSSRIQHPNVVHVEELGESGGTYYLVMEYVDGCSLAQLLSRLSRARRRLAPELAAYVAAQVADGLHAAHETRGDDGQLLGVVHRDVSPQNVLVSVNGHVKLIDFGVAKARGSSQHSTGSLRGKIGYMAPEQAYGRAVDRRTDVYALGVVLWEMLTGRRMFVADNDLALLDRVREPQIEPPSRHASGVTSAFDAVVLAALSPNAEERPATALEFRTRLLEVVPNALVFGPPQLAGLRAAVDEIAATVNTLANASTAPGDGAAATVVESSRMLETLTVPLPEGVEPYAGDGPDAGANGRAADNNAYVMSAVAANKTRAGLRSRVSAAIAIAGLCIVGIAGLEYAQHSRPSAAAQRPAIAAADATPRTPMPPQSSPITLAPAPPITTSATSAPIDTPHATAVDAAPSETTRRTRHPRASGRSRPEHTAQPAPQPAAQPDTVHAPGPFPTHLGI